MAKHLLLIAALLCAGYAQADNSKAKPATPKAIQPPQDRPLGWVVAATGSGGGLAVSGVEVMPATESTPGSAAPEARCCG